MFTFGYFIKLATFNTSQQVQNDTPFYQKKQVPKMHFFQHLQLAYFCFFMRKFKKNNLMFFSYSRHFSTTKLGLKFCVKTRCFDTNLALIQRRPLKEKAITVKWRGFYRLASSSASNVFCFFLCVLCFLSLQQLLFMKFFLFLLFASHSFFVPLESQNTMILIPYRIP